MFVYSSRNVFLVDWGAFLLSSTKNHQEQSQHARVGRGACHLALVGACQACSLLRGAVCCQLAKLLVPAVPAMQGQPPACWPAQPTKHASQHTSQPPRRAWLLHQASRSASFALKRQKAASLCQRWRRHQGARVPAPVASPAKSKEHLGRLSKLRTASPCCLTLRKSHQCLAFLQRVLAWHQWPNRAF